MSRFGVVDFELRFWEVLASPGLENLRPRSAGLMFLGMRCFDSYMLLTPHAAGTRKAKILTHPH